MGDASWQVICASPPHHAGKDLLHLKDSELTCPTHESSTSGHYRNMIVDEGMQISIPCINDSQDIMLVHWWTPHGQVTDNQPNLLIKDITEQHAGLYVCLSGLQGEHISVFDLYVNKKGSGSRPRREAAIIMDQEENKNTARNDPVVRQTRDQSEFVLAVCLSVIITFIVAFILGVLLRPLLDKLWRRIRSKRQSTPPPPTTTTSTGPQPYVNEGYCDVEDQEQELRVGSRVTFSEVTEVENQVPYYITVENDEADGSSESNTEVETLYETIEKNKSSITDGKQQGLEMEVHRGRADSSSSSLQEENALIINGKKLPPCSTEDMEFEPIPDADDITQLKRKGSSSTSSQSSHEGNFSKQTEQSVDPVTIPANKNTIGRIPGFSTEPFSEWSNRLTEQNVDNLDPELWNDSGESFSFTDCSERSSIRDLSSSAVGHPLKNDDMWRQSKAESPSEKTNLDSEVLDFDKPFGKEVLVDDLKQLELFDIVSSSNSSESGESVGGQNNYVVNPELMDESDTENYANLVTLKKFEDVTLNKRMPSAGILIRQETITLEPSDIRLTLTHGDSVDESMHIYDSPRKSKVDKCGICVDVGLDTVPKVKRYVEFKPFKPNFGPPSLPSFSHTSTKKNNTLSDIEVKSEANTDVFSGDNKCLTHIEVSPDRIQKVKRYIHFKHPEPHSPILSSSPSFTKKGDMLEAKSYSSSSDDDDAELTTKGNNLDVSSDGVSKVKRYILFKQIESSSPALSVSKPKIETTTEQAIKSLQPSTTPTSQDTSQNVNKHIYINQHKQHSSSLPSSPTSTKKGLSGKKSKSKKQDQSYYGSYDSLPLYHVHPAYRSSINRLNRGYDTDRSSSSEEDDTFLEYPTKLEITPGINRGVTTLDKKTDKVLNIDFDNSSSSTDVFDKKRSKGLMRLREISARLFNKHEHEPDEGNLQSHVQTKSKTKVTTNEDNLFGKGLSLDHLPKVKRYLQFSHSDSYPQVQLPSPPPTTGVAIPEFLAPTPGESRRSSFSSEDDVKQTTKDKHFAGQLDASYDTLPKVKRYIQFSNAEPCSTTLTLNKESISPELVAQPESRRSSTSSDDDIKLTTNEDSFFRKIGVSLDTVPNVKRYIQFNQPKPFSPTLTSSPISTKRPEAVVETGSSTSVKLDDKSDATENNFWGQINIDAVSKVKRYVQFTQSKHHFPTQPSVSSSTKVTTDMAVKPEATIDRSSGEKGYLMQTELSPENIQKVKRYIHFKQSEPHSPTLPSPPSLTMKDGIQETRRYSSSSDDDQLTTNEDNFFRKIDVSFDGVSKVKRFITFKESKPSSPTLSISSPTATTEAVKSMATSTSKDDVRSQNEGDHFFGKTDVSFDGISLDRVPQVKRYIQFKQPVSHLPVESPTTSDTLQVTTEVKTKSEAKRSSTSSEDDVKQTVDVSGKTEASLDGVPRVKRYIKFTHPEFQSPAQTTTGLSSERVNATIVAKETRRWSTSSEEDVIPTNKKENVAEETSEYLAKIPKVKRYITFTQSQPYSSNLSQFRPLTMGKSTEVTKNELKQPATRESTSSEDAVQEDNSSGKKGVSLNVVPRVKRYIQFTHPESQSPAQSTSAVSAQTLGTLGAVQDTRRPSTSSEEDVTLSAKEDNVFRHTGASLDKFPKVKRYIQFTKPESEPLVQTTALSANRLGISGVVQETMKSVTSSNDDVQLSTLNDDVFKQRGESFDKIPKVRRYIKFTQSEPSQVLAPSPLPSTEKSVKVIETGFSTLVSPNENFKEDSVVGQTEAHLNQIPRIKRYIQFTHQSPTQSTTSLSAERVGISEVILETRRSITSSEDDVTSKEDYFGGHTGAPLDKIPKVKRYIHFTHPESQSPAQTTTSLSAERVNVSVVAKETRIPSSSSEDDDKPSTNDGNVIGETGEFLDKIPKVKRYIEFTQNEPYSSAKSKLPSSSVAKSIKVTATELKGSSTSFEDYVQSSANAKKTASLTEITSSENLDRVQRVKRYIQFKPIESKYPARASTAVLAERVGISGVAQETKILSTSAVKPSGNIIGKNFFQETGVSLDKIPKVKRYIAFTKSEPSFSTKLMKRALTPATNTDFETTWSSLSSQVSPPASVKKGSALIIKTQSESWASEFTSKDNMKGELIDSSVEQTGLKSKVKYSSSSSSDEHSVGHDVVDVAVPVPQNEPPAVPQTSPPPLEPEEAREYLRENSEVRQRQERRRLQQQRKREMDEFNIASLSSIQQGDQQDTSPADYGEVPPFQTEHIYSNVSTRNTSTSRHAEGAEAPVLRGLKTKSTSTLNSKSTPKYREYLI
ncbi:uncharacterized protein lrrc66 isoform X2 [Carassius auratus]|nr:uncharacterized protein LOC113121000 isoform X2 [Carassius auratus]